MNLLLKEPYFGSINIKNQGRIYIGKQSLFNIRNSKTVVYDWRSTFGDAYYKCVKFTFIEKREIELLDIRSYYDKYHYEDRLNSFANILMEKVKVRKFK